MDSVFRNALKATKVMETSASPIALRDFASQKVAPVQASQDIVSSLHREEVSVRFQLIHRLELFRKVRMAQP